MPTQPQKRKINPLAIIAIILILLALGMLFLIFAPGPRMKWALTMGEKYLTDCEYTQAVTMFSRAIRVDDRSEPAYWGRAQAYVQLGDSAAATSDLTYIIDEIGTENADVYLTRADLYMDMGDTDAAQADLTAAASLGADMTAQASRLEALTRITVSLPTQIVNYDQLTGGTATLQYNADYWTAYCRADEQSSQALLALFGLTFEDWDGTFASHFLEESAMEAAGAAVEAAEAIR